MFGLPAPQRDARLRFEAHDYQNQVNYNIANEARLTPENQAIFNEQQKQSSRSSWLKWMVAMAE